MGYSQDSAPGEVLDKVARQLKLHAIRQDLRDVSGGKAIEVMGSQGDPHSIDFQQGYFSEPNLGRNCMFSFSGFRGGMIKFIREREKGLSPDQLLPRISDICAR